MSWEKPFQVEESSSASSSENVEDKIEGTTTQALHDSKNTDSLNGRSCSEKDSGFSDASSDWRHSEEKDQGDKNQQRATEEDVHLKCNEPLENSNRRNVIVAPQAQQLPFYVIKNMVQPHVVPKSPQVVWSGGVRPAVSGADPALLLQPPPPLFPKALSRNDVAAKKTAIARLPAKSYPRIAPLPSKKPAGDTTSNGGSFAQSKRVCVESCKTEATPEEAPSTSQSASCSLNRPASSVSAITTAGLDKHSVINTRHRRFRSTAQALKQSGLWDMTLRTKELMRQSDATTRDIAQLQQHSDLLCSSLQTPSPQTDAWVDLHRMMSESGCYPGLKEVQALRGPDADGAKPGSIQKGGGGDGGPLVSDTGLAEVTPQQAAQVREDGSKEPLGDTEVAPDRSDELREQPQNREAPVVVGPFRSAVDPRLRSDGEHTEMNTS